MIKYALSIDIFSVIVLLIIIVGLLYTIKIRYRSTKVLIAMLAVSFVSFSFDALGIAFEGRAELTGLLYVIYMMPPILSYIICCLGVWYMVEFVYEQNEGNIGRYRYLVFMVIINLIAIATVISIAVNGKFFSLIDGYFVMGELYRISMYMVTITPIALVVYLFASSQLLNRYIVKRLLLIPMGPLLGYALEIYHPEVSFSIAGVTIAYLLIYTFVMENELTGKIKAEEAQQKEIELGKQKAEAYNQLYEVQQQLEKEKGRLEMVHNLVHSGKWDAVIKNHKFDSIQYSDGFRKMLGYTDENDFPNETNSWRSALFLGDKSRAIAKISSYANMLGANNYEMEYRVYTKNKELRWVKGSGIVTVDENGNGDAFGTFIDTTEIHKIIEMQSIMEAMSEEWSFVVFVDGLSDYEQSYYFDSGRYGDIFKINNEITDFHERREWLKKFIHPDDVERFIKETEKDVVQNALREAPAYYVHFRFIIDGEAQYWKMKCAIANNDINKLVVGFICVDEETKAEIAYRKDLEKEKNRAEVASREKTRFLYGMAHDIRTPMNAIIGYADMAERNSNNPEKFQDAIGKMKSAGDILIGTVDKVLEISRIEEGKITVEEEVCDIVSMYHKYLEAVENMAREKNIIIEQTLRLYRNTNVYMDASIMYRIMVNVLSNAIKYTRNGGVIKYSLEQLNGDSREKPLYRFMVVDNGIGMSDDFKQSMFEEFAREKNEETSGIEGNGLGLSIVSKLVELLGGTVSIESEMGAGTSVDINIPFRLADKSVLEKKSQLVNPEDYDFGNVRALCVEDNAMNREIIKNLLEIYKVNVEEATDGKKAIEMITANDSDYYDVVFMDVQMAPMDGYEATRVIRKMEDSRKSVIPIVAVTANVFSEDITKAKEAGMDDYISKPINKDKILEMLKVHTKG